jgi:hypothetical protein
VLGLIQAYAWLFSGNAGLLLMHAVDLSDGAVHFSPIFGRSEIPTVECDQRNKDGNQIPHRERSDMAWIWRVPRHILTDLQNKQILGPFLLKVLCNSSSKHCIRNSNYASHYRCSKLLTTFPSMKVIFERLEKHASDNYDNKNAAW